MAPAWRMILFWRIRLLCWPQDSSVSEGHCDSGDEPGLEDMPDLVADDGLIGAGVGEASGAGCSLGDVFGGDDVSGPRG